MAGQQLETEITLQRRETKAIVIVVLQDKLNEAIAETANTIVKNNRVRFWFRHFS